MRKEKEIIENVLDVAIKDENIRSVIRTDLLPVRKYLYTYNFYFVVRDTEKYDSDNVFSKCFGERILLYRGDKNYPEMFPNTKAHLMVYNDGITIVVNIIDRATFLSKYSGELEFENVWMSDTFQKILDKDNDLPEIERLEEKQTLFFEQPTKEEFDNICNEFWWVLKTFAEYTLRNELPSAMFYLNIPVRDLLNRMLRWHICLKLGDSVDMGILDSNMEKVLEEYFNMYKRTYPNADYDSIWDAFDTVVELWSEVGKNVANSCGYKYSDEAEKNMLKFISRLRSFEFEN